MGCEVGVMTYEEALEVIENICPCKSKDCPDSDPIKQGELSLALVVAREEEFYVDGQIDAWKEDRVFGNEEVTDPW
jgi:hypothetical protein